MSIYRTMRHRPTCSRGFSLIELMVVLAIMAIVAAIAVPNYQSSIESSQKVSAANNILGALQFARSEAVIRRSNQVKVCASTNGSSCNGTDWSTGGVVLDNTMLLRTIPATPNIAISGNAITFNNDGTTTASTIDVGGKLISINIVGYAKIN